MYEDLNDPETLDDTPIGTLRVIPWCGQPAVALMHEGDPERPKRILHSLEPGENPLNAIYGRRTQEIRAVEALYDEKAQEKRAAANRTRAAHRKDAANAVRKQLSKSWDGSFRDALIARLSMGAS